MIMRKFKFSFAAAVLGLALLLGACSSDEGVSAEQVAEIVRDELAGVDTAASGADLSADLLDEVVAAVVAQLPERPAGVSVAEVEDLIDDAVKRALPAAAPRSQPAQYTQSIVDEAIRRYETAGVDATVDYYNNPASVDGQWYVFIIDADGVVISHFDPSRRYHNLNGWLGTDVSGYEFGPDMLSATESGKWVTYVYRNPEEGNFASGDFGDAELKNAWVVRHDGLLFASGWYTSVEDFIQTLVDQMLDVFDPASDTTDGIDDLLGPDAITSGLSSTLEYYNNAEGRGQSFAFVADSDGQIVSAFLNPELAATNIVDLLGPAALEATGDGVWITEDDNEPGTGPSAMRAWIINRDGYYFGGGWRATP